MESSTTLRGKIGHSATHSKGALPSSALPGATFGQRYRTVAMLMLAMEHRGAQPVRAPRHSREHSASSGYSAPVAEQPKRLMEADYQ